MVSKSLEPGFSSCPLEESRTLTPLTTCYVAQVPSGRGPEATYIHRAQEGEMKYSVTNVKPLVRACLPVQLVLVTIITILNAIIKGKDKVPGDNGSALAWEGGAA